MLDTGTEFGSRAARRLREELIIWLTTVRGDGLPQPSPVWFHWDGETFLIYSRPNTPKVRNIEGNSKVALNLDGDGRGGDIAAYIEKYRENIARIGMTPESFAADYSVAVRVTPTNLRGH